MSLFFVFKNNVEVDSSTRLDFSNFTCHYIKRMFSAGTFKMKKTDLQKEGFDPALVKQDKLYYLDLKLNKYLPLGPEEYQKIITGAIRL